MVIVCPHSLSAIWQVASTPSFQCRRAAPDEQIGERHRVRWAHGRRQQLAGRRVQ
jgi:hypothetical protein